MRKNISYLTLFIAVVVSLWVVYFIQTYWFVKQDGFATLYRPYIRHINHRYETFMNNYGPNVIIHKLKRWNLI